MVRLKRRIDFICLNLNSRPINIANLRPTVERASEKYTKSVEVAAFTAAPTQTHEHKTKSCGCNCIWRIKFVRRSSLLHITWTGASGVLLLTRSICKYKQEKATFASFSSCATFRLLGPLCPSRLFECFPPFLFFLLFYNLCVCVCALRWYVLTSISMFGERIFLSRLTPKCLCSIFFILVHRVLLLSSHYIALSILSARSSLHSPSIGHDIMISYGNGQQPKFALFRLAAIFQTATTSSPVNGCFVFVCAVVVVAASFRFSRGIIASTARVNDWTNKSKRILSYFGWTL